LIIVDNVTCIMYYIDMKTTEQNLTGRNKMKNKIEIKVAYKKEGEYRVEEYVEGVLKNSGRITFENYGDARRSQKVAQKFYDEFPEAYNA